MIVQQLHRRVAEPAPRHIDDAFEREVVGRRRDAAQIGERVADLRALIKARAADHAIRQAEGDEAVFQFAHLKRRAHQDRDLVEPVPPALQLFDLLADRARLLLGIPRAGDRYLFARLVLGAQRLAEAAFIVGDEMRSCREDMAGRAVVALEADHLGAGKVLLEAQDVVDLGTAPAVDRLVVVADAAQIFRPLAEQPEPQVLRNVGVLIFVDQHEPEALVILAQHVRMLAQQPDRLEQKIAEIGGVEHLQPLLIRHVELEPAPARKARGLARRHLFGREPAVFPAVDHGGERARRPALLVDVLGFQHLLEQAQLIVDVENREVGFEPHQFRMPAQHLHADRVERAEPRHALDHLADHAADPLLHLPRGLVGEGHREDFGRPRAAEREDVRNPGGEHEGLDGEPLFRVKSREIGRARTRVCARGNAARHRRRRSIEGTQLVGLGHPCVQWPSACSGEVGTGSPTRTCANAIPRIRTAKMASSRPKGERRGGVITR